MRKRKICFVLNANPESLGGTPIVVRNLMRYIKSDVFYGRGKGIFSFLYPFITAIKLLFRNYDVVNIHDTQGYVYAILPKFLRKKSKIVYTCHGLWKVFFDAEPPKGLLQKIKANFAIIMQKSIIKNADHIIAVSNFVKRKLIEFYKVSNKKITVIHNGVDTKKFRPFGTKNKDMYIWVGTNPKLKMLNKAIEFAKSKNKKLLVVGIDGKSDKHVKYIGKVKYDKMPKIYNKATHLIFFSRAEGHPLVPLEAMACGLGIIANKSSNIEIVPPNQNGNYVISRKSALKVIKKYDWKEVAKRHLDVINKVLLEEFI